MPSIEKFAILGLGVVILIFLAWYIFFSIEPPTVSVSRCDLINSQGNFSTILEVLVSNKNQANSVSITGIFQPNGGQSVSQAQIVQLAQNQQATVQFAFPSAVSTTGACDAKAAVVLGDSDLRAIGMKHETGTGSPTGIADKLSCPSSCDDGNPCTQDYCSRDTSFACQHGPLDGDQVGCSGSSGAACRYSSCQAGQCAEKTEISCCGNGICEKGEDLTSCSADCKPSITFSCTVPPVIYPASTTSPPDNKSVSNQVSCSLTNTGNRSANVTVTSSFPSWSDSTTQSVTLAPGERKIMAFSYKFNSNFYSNDVLTPAAVSYGAEQEGRQIYAATQNTQIGAKGDIDWSDAQVAYTVTPQDPCVEGVLSIAKENIPGRSLVGYLGGPGEVDAQAKAIYEALQDLGISYVNSPVSFSGTQRVRLPYESINEKSGNCADGAILFASLFENLGMEPVIITIPGHAFVAVKDAAGSHTFIPIETTMLGSTATYEEAATEATNEYAQNKNNANFYDINQLRSLGDLPRPQVGTSTCNLQLRTCNDGTQENHCSSSKPQYCSAGVLIGKASSCGCPSGQVTAGDSCIGEIAYQTSLSIAPSTSSVVTGAGDKVLAFSSDIPVDITLEANAGGGNYPGCSAQNITSFTGTCPFDGNELVIQNNNANATANVQVVLKNLPS